MRIIFLICALAILTLSRANHAYSDSLQKLVPQTSGSKLADLLLDIGIALIQETGNADTLIHYCNLSLIESRKTGDIQEQVYAYKLKATAYSVDANYDESLIQLKIALGLAMTIKDTSSIADVNNKLGYNAQMMNQTEKALTHYIEAAELFEQLQDWDELAIVYLNISSIFSSLRRMDEMKHYMLKMVQLKNKIRDSYNVTSVLAYAASSYAEFAETNATYADTALFYAQEGLKTGNLHGFYGKSAEISITMGNVEQIRKDFKTSITHYADALKYRDFMRDASKFNAFRGLQKAYNEVGQIALARNYLDSMKLQGAQLNYETYTMEVMKISYEFYKSTGELDSALNAFESYFHLHDSLVSVERATKISELEQQYNKEKNENTITELNQANEIIGQENEIQDLRINQLIIGVALLIMILAFGAFLFWQSNKNKKQKLIDIEQRLNRARMNPHFVFNVLAALQSLNYNETRKNEVARYISRFSKIMRQSLESTFTEFTSLESELEFLTDYMELQKLLTEDRFNYQIDVDESIDAYELKIPGMILQPFIENAIEHGFKSLTSGGEINLKIEKREQLLFIQLSDNGQGFHLQNENKLYPSRATQVITDRLYLLKEKTKKNARFEISESDMGGVKVTIFLPLLYAI